MQIQNAMPGATALEAAVRAALKAAHGPESAVTPGKAPRSASQKDKALPAMPAAAIAAMAAEDVTDDEDLEPYKPKRDYRGRIIAPELLHELEGCVWVEDCADNDLTVRIIASNKAHYPLSTLL